MFCSSRITFNVIYFAFRYTSCTSVEQIKCGYYIVTFEFMIDSFRCRWQIGSNYNLYVRLNYFRSATLTQRQLCSPACFKGALVSLSTSKGLELTLLHMTSVTVIFAYTINLF